MKHSNQIREYLLTPEGIQLEDVYIGPEGVLTGSMRAAQEARERAAQIERSEETSRKQRDLERRRLALEAQIASLRAEFKATEEEEAQIAKETQVRERVIADARDAAGKRRGVDSNEAAPPARKRK
jgi:circadian clock protein KaiC